MPWIVTLESSVKPRMTTRLAIENHRNHPRIATAASTTATLMPMPYTALAARCIQSEAVGRILAHDRSISCVTVDYDMLRGLDRADDRLF